MSPSRGRSRSRIDRRLRARSTRAYRALALTLTATWSGGCASAGAGEYLRPGERAERAVTALDVEAFAAAREELTWLAERCESGDAGRRALLMLAAVELDPGNPYGSPRAAARAAASYLLLPDAEREQRPLARGLYRLAVDLGASAGDVSAGGLGADGPSFAHRFSRCDSGTEGVSAHELPTTPPITTAMRLALAEAELGARTDSLAATEQRLAVGRERIAALEAEIERITALLREGAPRARSTTGRR